ncbi:hypothetical protein HZB00_03820 [Candidatus Woesearchaeota archaeon]|nr:hypothetical protein [Candidatus Woesearchaeota archaeon]
MKIIAVFSALALASCSPSECITNAEMVMPFNLRSNGKIDRPEETKTFFSHQREYIDKKRTAPFSNQEHELLEDIILETHALDANSIPKDILVGSTSKEVDVPNREAADGMSCGEDPSILVHEKDPFFTFNLMNHEIGHLQPQPPGCCAYHHIAVYNEFVQPFRLFQLDQAIGSMLLPNEFYNFGLQLLLRVDATFQNRKDKDDDFARVSVLLALKEAQGDFQNARKLLTQEPYEQSYQKARAFIPEHLSHAEKQEMVICLYGEVLPLVGENLARLTSATSVYDLAQKTKEYYQKTIFSAPGFCNETLRKIPELLTQRL